MSVTSVLPEPACELSLPYITMALLPVEYDTEAHRCTVTADLLGEVMQKRHVDWLLGTLLLRLCPLQEYVCVECRLHCDAGCWP